MDQIESIQEIYNICKKFEEMRLFAKKIPFNNSEMQFMKHILIANEKGEKIFSSEIAKAYRNNTFGCFSNGSKIRR